MCLRNKSKVIFSKLIELVEGTCYIAMKENIKQSRG